MKPFFALYDDDPRRHTDKTYPFNKGSFAQIIDGINSTLLSFSRYADPKEADVVGATSSLSPLRGFAGKQKFFIHAWETNQLPDFMVQWARSGAGGQRLFALSEAVANTWKSYGIHTPVVDIGVDTNFWHPLDVPKFEKFTITMLTCANFRSNIQAFLDAVRIIHKQTNTYRFIIKNTHEGAKKIPALIEDMRNQGIDIEYHLGRWDAFRVRELIAKSQSVVYIPSNTGAGLPILEAGAVGTEVITLDYPPCNGYPVACKVPCEPVKLSDLMPDIELMGLPFEFPKVPGLEPEKCEMFYVDPKVLAERIIYEGYHRKNVGLVQQEISKYWTWQRATTQLLSHFEITL